MSRKVLGITVLAMAPALWISVSSAHAEIAIAQINYAAGVLVVRGETGRPNQRVTLDGRYRTRTNHLGEFQFRIRYLPHDCTVTIRTRRDVRPARVANC